MRVEQLGDLYRETLTAAGSDIGQVTVEEAWDAMRSLAGESIDGLEPTSLGDIYFFESEGDDGAPTHVYLRRQVSIGDDDWVLSLMWVFPPGVAPAETSTTDGCGPRSLGGDGIPSFERFEAAMRATPIFRAVGRVTAGHVELDFGT
jgi:hypothetical protein